MNRKWWKEAVVYQIYPKSFQDTDRDGIGDLAGIISRLDYLEMLGINTIWLCPINVSPMRDNGYDIADYYKIDPSFGTNEDLEELVEKASERGIRVLMDLVVNHCSDQHPWFQEAVKNPDSKYASYFIIKETDGEAPNNIRCYNAVSAWERIGDSNRFYFHSFAKEQPDLNWENPFLRREIIEMMKFWQQKGIAGFRIDAIGNIKKSKYALAQGMLPPDGDDGMVSVDKYVLMQDGIEEYLQELKEEVFDKYDMMTVAEVSVPEERMEQFIGENGLFSMVFDFSYTDMDIEKRNGKEWKRPWTIGELKKKIYDSQNSIQKHGWGSPYLENHDQPRSVNKYIPRDEISYESKTALGALYFFLRGTPFIYQGQEIGMENYPFRDVKDLRDPFAVSRYQQSVDKGEDPENDMEYFRERGRDNSRTPMQWDDSTYAGFSDVEPWINVNPDYTQINVKGELDKEISVFHFYQKMINLRKDPEYGETLTFGAFQAVGTQEEALIGYRRTDDNYRITIWVNLSNKVVELPKSRAASLVILNNRTELEEDRLLPYQTIVEVEGGKE